MKILLKVTILSFAFATTTMSAYAQSKAPVFTTVKANPITSVKDQNRSGTCWDYATCGLSHPHAWQQPVLGRWFVRRRGECHQALRHRAGGGDDKTGSNGRGQSRQLQRVLPCLGVVYQQLCEKHADFDHDTMATRHEGYPRCLLRHLSERVYL